MTDRFPDFLNPAVDTSGNAISGARLFFYRVGTSTKKDTYSDSDKTVPNANPVVADSGGRFGDIFMLTDEQYKVVLADTGIDDPPSTPIKTWDNVSPARSNPIADIEVISKSADYTVLTGDKGKFIEVDASSAPVTITLPAVASATNGFFVYVKKVDSSANAVTVDGDAAETIDGSSTFVLSGQYDTTLVVTDGTEWHAFQPVVITPLPPGHQSGLTLSADAGDTANDVNVTAGSARDGDDTENIVLASEITKQVNAAWAVGDDAGGLDTGTVADGNRYFIWLVKRTDTDIEDVLFSLSNSSPTMPANYTKKRLIGSFDRVAGANTQLTKINSRIVLQVNTQTGAVATGTTTIPRDDTIPQITEGDEYMTLPVTPTNASNILEIEVVFNFAHSATGDFVCCLFQDAVPSALAVSTQFVDSIDSMYSIAFRHRMTAGTTSSTTFRVRAGQSGAGTTTFNGRAGGRLYGGTIASSITITEIAA